MLAAPGPRGPLQHLPVLPLQHEAGDHSSNPAMGHGERTEGLL